MPYRFFYPHLKKNTLIELDIQESLHAIKVLRLKKNTPVEICNGEGLVADASIKEIHDKKNLVYCQIDKLYKKERNLPNITIYLSLPKKKIITQLLSQLASLGVAQITPIKCQQSQNQPINNHSHNRKALIYGIKQSKNPFLPKINKIICLEEALETAQEDFLFYGSLNNNSEIRTKEKSIGIFIGPEAGFSEKELCLLNEKTQAIKCGEYIMKIETACIALVAKFL